MRNRKIFYLAFFIVLVGVFVWLNNSGLNSGLKQNEIIKPSEIKTQIITLRQTAKVLRVVDGDTLKVEINNKEDTVRLIGIDSPEIVDEKKPVQCFGKEASDKAKEILTGKIITLESDPTQRERDEYVRLLRYVFLEDGTNFNKLMLSEGFAHEYTFKDNFYRYQSEFIKAGEEAKESNRGLWQKCARN